jgi:hypothetical protein
MDIFIYIYIYTYQVENVSTEKERDDLETKNVEDVNSENRWREHNTKEFEVIINIREQFHIIERN